MIDSIGKMIMAGGDRGWIVPLIVFLFYAFINISKVIAERRKQQKLDEQPTDMQKPRHKPIDGLDYTTTRRARNLPYAPKHDRPVSKEVSLRIQSRPEVKPIPVARPAQTPAPPVQRPVPIQRRTPVQQTVAQPTKRLRRQQPRAVQKTQIPQKTVTQTKQPVPQKTQTRKTTRTPAARPGLIQLFQNSNELKKGILYAEILGKPIALRDDQNVGLL